MVTMPTVARSVSGKRPVKGGPVHVQEHGHILAAIAPKYSKTCFRWPDKCRNGVGPSSCAGLTRVRSQKGERQPTCHAEFPRRPQNHTGPAALACVSDSVPPGRTPLMRYTADYACCRGKSAVEDALPAGLAADD